MYIFGCPNWIDWAWYGIFLIRQKPTLRAGMINKLKRICMIKMAYACIYRNLHPKLWFKTPRSQEICHLFPSSQLTVTNQMSAGGCFRGELLTRPACRAIHLFRANTIRFLDKALATQHLTPKNDPQIWPKKWPSKMTLQKDPPWFMHTKFNTMPKLKSSIYWHQALRSCL